MKKHLLIFLVCLLAKNSYSQSYIPFPEDSAQWSIWQHGLDSNSMQNYIFSYQLKMIGDTLINGISYNKIYKSYDIAYPSNSDSLHCFIRQDTAQKKVFVRYPYYMYSDSTEILLNDFSLQVGDTFNLKLISDGSFHPAIITASGTWPTNIGFTNLLVLSFINPWVWGPACDAGCQWLEGIGNFCNLLLTEMSPLECDFPFYHFYNTECFWQNGVYVTGGTFCDFATGFNENSLMKNEIEVYPNPVKDFAIIDFKNNDIVQLNIYNMMGTLIKTTNLNHEKKHLLSVEDFQNGLYLINAIDKKGNTIHTYFNVVK